MSESGGLGAALGRLTGTLLDLATDRLRLLGIEAREFEIRLAQVVLLAVCGAGLLLVAASLAVAAVLFAAPEAWRWPLAAGLAGACLLAALVALIGLRRRLARLPLAFAQTIEELTKDRACF